MALVCYNTHQFTTLTTAIALSAESQSLAGCVAVLVQAESQNVRWWDDGLTDPTASTGHQLEAGKSLFYDIAAISGLKFIEEVAGAKLNVSYYRGQNA